MTKKNTDNKLRLLEPRATEKSYLEQTNRIYVFPVKREMNKHEIAKMIENEFDVTVTNVRTMIRNGKKTRFSRGRHAYPGTTYRQDKKFAYVRLKEGDSIRVFDEPAVEEPKKNDKTSAKDSAAKTEDKNAGKENK